MCKGVFTSKECDTMTCEDKLATLFTSIIGCLQTPKVRTRGKSGRVVRGRSARGRGEGGGGGGVW